MTEQDRILTKCAWRLVPFMGLLYLMSLIDRLNVGFAALTMNKDLGFSDTVYGLGASIFFVGYFLFQIPSSLALERVGARRWLFFSVAAWGAISASNAFVQGPLSFYAVRLLLGSAEAGLFPGLVLYLTYWFPQDYRARCIAYFMAASPLAFIVGGPIAGIVLEMDSALGLRGWQWLFLIEGLPAFALAFAVLKMLPDRPANAPWLNQTEKDVIATRLAADTGTEHRELWPALLDPRLYALGVVYIAVGAGSYGMRLWLPQIVKAMGFTNLETGFVTAAPYALAMAAMMVWAKSSDTKGERIWHVVLPILLAAGGFFGAALAPSDAMVLAALVLVVLGLDAVIGPFWTLPSSFLQGRAAAGGIALVNTFGTGLGGFLGPLIIGIVREATGSYAGSMAALGFGLVLSSIVMLALGRMITTRAVPKVA